VKRLAFSVLAVVIAWLCSACLATTGGGPNDIPPAAENRPQSSLPTPSVTPSSATPPSATASRAKPQQETLAFGKGYTWHDGVRMTVGKPKKFRPSKWAVLEKSKVYVKFTVSVVNKSKKPIDLGLTYISVQSRNKEADQLFDSMSGLKGPPDKKVSKGKASEFEVGFGVADPADLAMEIALHDDLKRPTLRYST
jgi:hypothetical protein